MFLEANGNINFFKMNVNLCFFSFFDRKMKYTQKIKYCYLNFNDLSKFSIHFNDLISIIE